MMYELVDKLEDKAMWDVYAIDLELNEVYLVKSSVKRKEKKRILATSGLSQALLFALPFEQSRRLRQSQIGHDQATCLTRAAS